MKNAKDRSKNNLLKSYCRISFRFFPFLGKIPESSAEIPAFHFATAGMTGLAKFNKLFFYHSKVQNGKILFALQKIPY